MPVAPLTAERLIHRHRLLLVGLSTAVVAATIYSAATGYSTGHFRYQHVGAYGPSHRYELPTPTSAQQAATLTSTQAYRRLIVTATQNFATATAQLAKDVDAGRLVEARRDEVVAQSAFDEFRAEVPSGLGALAPLDTLVVDQPFGSPPSGLHAVERALWTGSLASARRESHQLADAALSVELALFRTIITPSEICEHLQELLGWTVQNVISSPQERYSHLNMTDVRAVAAALSSQVSSLTALGDLVAPHQSADVRLRAHELLDLVATVPSGANDVQVSAATWRAITQHIDALVGPLGQLGGSLYGYGTGRNYA